MKIHLLLWATVNVLLFTACNDSKKGSEPAPPPGQETNHVIYGDDDRKDFNEVTDPALREMARSTVALIADDRMVYDSVFDVYNFENENGTLPFCPKERFQKQSDWAYCSGSLIGPDLVLTAGHCIEDDKTCRHTKFVFDYVLTGSEQHIDSAKRENTYECDSIVYTSTGKAAADFALIKLDRPVKDRTPLTFSDKAVTYQDKLMMIGYPSGYPTKFTFNADVRNLMNDQFMVLEIDAFTGNSGSSVFDQQTHQIVGVLARGENDFERKNNCLQSKVCAKGECRGEDVTRAEIIKKYLPKD